ncbi:TonB-dependent receptor [Niastella koreensis]|uniref:TonB-dependent receptor n=2 Tax=Niastella koreensis TaxID=354356 RepID=G8TP75_NIAKG|nr:TonB-dependent receptor [Niastella koreensis]AEV96681.1 TonB-dependent receptor [Niastella koreensis GR20-10]OQP44341.1 TonB-dependent receptor [Niastella koreensis]
MIRPFALALIILLVGNSAVAQDTGFVCTTTTALKEVVVSYQADKLTPVTFQNISSKDLKVKSVGQEPSFILNQTPSITNYSDAGNSQGYSYFRMRGIDQTRINISLDGVPLNDPEDQGAYFSNYPDLLNSVSSMQIQRGAGTSKNGVASYGGSLQLFSPNLYDSAKTTIGVGYGSFNSLRAFGEYNSGVKNRKALYARVSEVYADGYKYNSANNSQSAFVSGAWFADKTSWRLNVLAGHQQNQLAWLGVSDTLIAIDRRTNGNKNERDKFTQWMTQLLNTWRLSYYSNLQSGLYYSTLKGGYDYNNNNFLGLPTTDKMYHYAFQSQLVGFYSNYNLIWNGLNVTTGAHGNIYNRQHTFTEKTLGQLYTNTGYKNEASAFVKAVYNISWLSLFTDLQYRYTEFDYQGTVHLNKLNWNFFNPKVGASIQINPDVVAYYSVARTGREPTRNDLFLGNDDLLADSIGNPLISSPAAEFVVDHEAGLRFRSKHWNVNLNWYYMNFENEIVLNGKFGPNGLALTNNVEKSFRTGVELSAAFHLDQHFTFTNNSSYNHSRIKEQKVKFSPVLTPAVIINQEAAYAYRNFSIAMTVRYQDKSFIDFANTSSINGYTLLNSRVGYNYRKFEFAIFANNLTNAKYFNNGYVDYDGSKKYFVQAPTTVYASVKVTL